MLRLLYSLILRMHPAYFRQRFAEEMLMMFDMQSGRLARSKTLLDGAVSLIRQWTSRPEFWANPNDASGSPFSATARFAPRPSALLDGALISVLTFATVCGIMQYTWNHPVVWPILSYYRAKPSAKTPAALPVNVEIKKIPPVYVDGGRVILMVQNPATKGRK